ncbi:MAG TPA: DUF418 domain-containing protein [Homoserinimonas sp.]|nr:DUF418 domain-containing protein [Homoserinimonas sp.]
MRVQALRIVGIDVARGLAVLGMFIAHTYPRADEAELIVDGRSAILFATLAGVSLGLLTGGENPGRSSRAVARRGVIIRAAFLFLLGVMLTLLPSHIAIILDYYGIMFALMIPMLFLPRLALSMLAALLAVAAPLAAAWVGAAGEQTGWTGVAVEYLLLGHYPALVWLPFLLVGLLCTRSGLTRPATQRWMVFGGALAMVLGYGTTLVIRSVTAEAHSGSTAEVVGSGGFAIALIGILLWLDRFRASRLALHPIAAAGSMPLTIYTLQILLLAGSVAFANAAAWVPDYPGLPLMFGLIIASLVFSTVWRLLLGAGPLERMLRFLAGFDRTASNRTGRTGSRRR